MNDHISNEFRTGYNTAIDQIEFALEFFNWYCSRVSNEYAPLDKFYKAYRYYAKDTYPQLHIKTLNKRDFLRLINKLYVVDVKSNIVHGVKLQPVANKIFYKNEGVGGVD